MTAVMHRRSPFLLALIAAAAGLFTFAGPQLRTARADDGNVPVFTSPIDITGVRLQLQATVPDRNTGQPVNYPLPVELLGEQIATLANTPISTLFDNVWSVEKRPGTNQTFREALCGLAKQKMDDVVKLAGPDYTVYDYTCNLAPTGLLLAQKSGSSLTIAYTLLGNSLEAYLTTPVTCNRNSPSTPVCPHDPGVKVRFALQVAATLQTPDLCHLSASDATVHVQAFSADIEGLIEPLQFVDRTFLGGKYDQLLEQTVEGLTQQFPLPLESTFKGVRESDACAGKTPVIGNALRAFNSIDTEIDLRQGLLILRAVHTGIPTPRIDVPDPSVPLPARLSGFATQEITTDAQTVAAGDKVTVTGSGFPAGNAGSTSLTVNIGHGDYGREVFLNSRSSVCLGGTTEVEWGPVGGTLKVDSLPGGAAGRCPMLFSPMNLTPRTTYQFRARDCDPLTCSPWTAPARATTAQDAPNLNTVALTLDNGTSLGTTATSINGGFTTEVTIPAGTTPGTHQIRAVGGGRDARVDITVTAQGASGAAPGSSGTGSIRLADPRVDGCETLPDNPRFLSTAQRPKIYGTGFAPGRVEIRFDSTTGPLLATPTAGPDGRFCNLMAFPPGDRLGPRVLVAVQNGSIQARLDVEVDRPVGPR